MMIVSAIRARIGNIKQLCYITCVYSLFLYYTQMLGQRGTSPRVRLCYYDDSFSELEIRGEGSQTSLRFLFRLPYYIL